MNCLTRLETLSLDVYNKDEKFNLNNISGLTELKDLSLSGFDIQNLKSLSNLTNMEWLRFNSLQLVDISPLAGMKHLQGLALDDNKIQDITPLAGLSSLNEGVDFLPVILFNFHMKM